MFYNTFSSSSGSPMEPLTVVTISLIGGKTNRAKIIIGITCLWDSGATNSTISIKHTKPYGSRMNYNKVE